MVLIVGDQAPDFTLPASTGEEISLEGLRGQKVVLYFYPKDDTPGCTIEACGFRDANDDIRDAGAVVLGMSPDSLESHDKFISKFELNFPLLSDVEKETINAYDAWGEKETFGKKSMGILRKTFLIDERGKIAQIWPTVSVDGHADEVLTAVRGN
jgi:peroxiredoxin Q/BCP